LVTDQALAFYPGRVSAAAVHAAGYLPHAQSKQFGFGLATTSCSSQNRYSDYILLLPVAEATTLAQLLKRIDYEACNRFASPTATCDGRAEGDVMWSAICLLQRQLAEIGFAPR
jgi:hypothetical protein